MAGGEARLTQLTESQLVERIETAIDWIDENVEGDP